MQRDVRRPGDRRVAAGDERRQRGEHVAPLEHDLVVLGAEVLRHARGDRQFAALVVGEAGRKGGEPLMVLPGERDDRRGVEAAGKEHAHGARRRHRQLDRLVQALNEALERLCRAAAQLPHLYIEAVRWRPVPRLAQRAELPESVSARRKLAHASDQRARAAHIALGEIFANGCAVDLYLDPGRAHQRSHLGGKAKRAAPLVQVERLLAEAVACEHQAVLARVPQREREGAAQLLDHILVPVLVGAQQELGVALRLERIAALRKLVAQLRGVEDRAVESERDAARRVR